MSDQYQFQGTPDDWWENAENLTVLEAEHGRQLGCWYIIKVNSAGKTRHSYRLSTPSRPPNMDDLMKNRGPHSDMISERVRLLIRGEVELEPWRLAPLVIADTGTFENGKRGVERHPWIRRNGRWRSIYNGQLNINDHSMSELNPVPAKIIEENPNA